ncbi:unnamed protein product [Prorocentrum cordatum]|uniref:Solute carrier family 40 protein n=1 Tax=Prorocentrum cordatum TaxID=2364126 RepID=A0ABN9S6X1_9DINO|nr:unnamed protein product [Polarella glacialis]
MPTSVSQALCSLAGGKAPPTDVSVAYGLFGACALTVYHFVANGEFSAVLTMAVMLQCLAISLLCLQTLANGSATGLSARALGMEAASLALRLSSTTWLNGYLPVDASGDLVYQLVDACSLAMVLWLLRQVAVVHRGSYQADADTLPVGHMLLGAFALAALLHDLFVAEAHRGQETPSVPYILEPCGGGLSAPSKPDSPFAGGHEQPPGVRHALDGGPLRGRGVGVAAAVAGV